jgi:hypothetical protein
MSDVVLDRLVLSLPGVTEAYARALALGLAEGLAGAQVSGDIESLSIDVDPAAPPPPASLAARIVQTLIDRIG